MFIARFWAHVGVLVWHESPGATKFNWFHQDSSTHQQKLIVQILKISLAVSCLPGLNDASDISIEFSFEFVAMSDFDRLAYFLWIQAPPPPPASAKVVARVCFQSSFKWLHCLFVFNLLSSGSIPRTFPLWNCDLLLRSASDPSEHGSYYKHAPNPASNLILIFQNFKYKKHTNNFSKQFVICGSPSPLDVGPLSLLAILWMQCSVNRLQWGLLKVLSRAARLSKPPLFSGKSKVPPRAKYPCHRLVFLAPFKAVALVSTTYVYFFFALHS